MIRSVAVAVAVFACMPLLAQQAAVPPSQTIDATMIRTIGDELLKQARTSPEGVSSKTVLTRADGFEQVAARVKSGIGEWHHDHADVLIILDGKGEMITGGEIVNGKQTGPGEIRGEGVKGGKKSPFATGDVIRIEPRVAHQMLLAPGTVLRYYIIKVKE